MAKGNDQVGKIIGNYRILSKITCGSFGCVYQAQHTILTERPTIAIKLMHITYLHAQKERENFLKEARLLERLKHPHILPIVDVAIHEDLPYLVAEYASNGSLRDRLKRQPRHPLPIDEAIP